ncbi:hypothetical protein Tco_0710704, partial [Tanacetum coccineum]
SERDKVFNPQPVSQFNLVAGQVVLSNVNVNESDKAPVVAVGADKLFDLVKDKANVVKDKVKDTAVDAVNDKALDVVKEKRKTELLKDKPKDKAPRVIKSKDKDPPIVKENAKDKPNDKPTGKPAVDVVNDKALNVVNEKRKTKVMMDKPKDKASSVVKDRVPEVVRPVVDAVKDKPVVDVVKDKPEIAPKVVKERRKTELPKDKSKGKAPSVVKSKVSTKLPKDKAKDKPFVVKGNILNELSKAKHKADLPKDKPKPKDKNNVVSEVHVLRILSKENHGKNKFGVKMIKGKMDIEYFNSELDSDEVDFESSSDEVTDRKPKKMKTKAELKKRKSGSDSDSMFVDEEKVMCMLKKLKKIKKEDSDEESGLKSKKKDKKKEKLLTPEEAAHKEYLRCFPTLRARIVSTSLFSTIRSARVDMWNFFVRNRLSLDTGDYVEVTPSKIHDILGDIASKLVFAQEVDFLFKVNFLTLFTNTMARVAGLRGHICLDVVRHLHEDCVISKINWCSYIHSCLEDSKLSKKRTVQYLGPFTFLIFNRFPVVCTRPTIRDWTSTLMRQRQDLETKEHVIGCLELHDEWTESELQETEGFTRVSSLETFEREALFKKAEEKLATICSERVFLEDLIRKDSLVYPDGGNDSDGDDDNDQGNVDEDLNDKEPLGSNPSFGFSKVNLDDFDKPSGSGKSPKNQVVEKESVNPSVQEYEILSTPESYTQWLERNADLVGEMIDSITDEYLYGDLFGQNLVTMEVLNQGPLTPDRMPIRASKVSPSPEKRVVKPSSYLLSPYMNKKTKVVPKITRMEFIVGNSFFAMQGDKMHFFPTGCITKSIFEGTLASDEGGVEGDPGGGGGKGGWEGEGRVGGKMEMEILYWKRITLCVDVINELYGADG